MFWVYLTLTLMLVPAVPVRAEASSEAIPEVIQTLLETRCSKNANVEILEDAIVNINDCFQNQESIQNEDDSYKKNCLHELPLIYQCYGSFFSAVEPCLEPDEKYFPDFLLENFNHSFHRQCQHGPDYIIELSTDLKNSECARRFGTIRTEVYEKCILELKLLKDYQEPDFVFRNSYVCGDLFSGYECTVAIFKEVCKDSFYEKFLGEILEDFLTWCSKHKTH